MTQAKDEKPVISLERVHKRYGGFVAVHEASFEIRRGEFFSMLGPSGCGKTTLLRMIAGFEEVTSGVLRLDGVDVVSVPPYRRSVNTVFQNYALFPHLSVFDNVAFGPRIRSLERGDRCGAERARRRRRRREPALARRGKQIAGGPPPGSPVPRGKARRSSARRSCFAPSIFARAKTTRTSSSPDRSPARVRGRFKRWPAGSRL